MRVISSSELRNNLKKYLDLAVDEKIVIQRGQNETFVLTREDYLAPDEDFSRAISFESFKEEAINHVKNLYKQTRCD